MGARYLKAEEDAIRDHYPTASRLEILELIPNRTWAQIGARARRMGVHRTSESWGNSVRDGRKLLPDSWSVKENLQILNCYPSLTCDEICAAIPHRSWNSITTHARKLGISRTKEAKVREIQIGRRKVRKEKEEFPKRK